MPSRRYSVHGLAVEIDCCVTELHEAMRHVLAPFEVSGWPEGFNPVSGTIEYFDQAKVLRGLSPRAAYLPDHKGLVDVFQDGERFWIIDDRWGMAEVNLLKSQWRAWVLPHRRAGAADEVRTVDSVVVWPMAQLLRPRGLHLVPAVAVARENTGILLVSPCSLEQELRALVAAGYRVIGQRWVGVRDEDGSLSLLRFPGRIERSLIPRLRSVGVDVSDGWVDLDAECPTGVRHHAYLRAVLIADPVRRASAELRELDAGDAATSLRRAWPIVELHPRKRPSTLVAQIAGRCYAGELQLSREPQDLVSLLAFVRPTQQAPIAPAQAA